MGEFESLNNALIECVRKAGGSKIVGHKMWPEKTVDAAKRHLLACLNEDKQERLSPEHLLMLLRLAREKGYHGGFDYMAVELSYAKPIPIEPPDEMGDLIRKYLSRKESEQASDSRLERMLTQYLAQRPELRAVA